MVAAASHPPLTAEDGKRLQAICEAGRSPFTLAAATDTPIHEIIDWLALPHIQEHIQRLDALEDRAERAADKLQRAAAIKLLREAAEKTDDLVEKRRAACAILRALARPRIQQLKTNVHAPPTPAPARSTSIFSPSPARTSHSATEAPQPQSEPQSQSQSEPRPELPPKPPDAPKPEPPPDFHALPRPSPQYDAARALTIQLRALQNAGKPFAHAGPNTVYNFATEDYLGLDPDRDTFASQFATRFGNLDLIGFGLSDPLYDKTGDNATFQVTLEYHPKPGTTTGPTTRTFTWDLTRPRDGPHANCWLTCDVHPSTGPPTLT